MTQVPPGESLLAGRWEWPIWLGAVAIISASAALLSIWLGRHHSSKAKFVWTVIALLLPIFGPAAWFLLGRQRRGGEGQGSGNRES